MPEKNYRFTTRPKSITPSGDLAWGGSSNWKNELEQNSDVVVTERGIQPRTVPESGVSRWAFNGDATDSWGDNNATVTNAVYTEDVEQGDVISYTEEQGHYIEVPDDPSLRPPSFSVAAWFRCPVEADSWENIAAKDYWDNNEGWALVVDNGRGDTLNFVGPTIGATDTGYAVDDGRWHHAVGVYDDQNSETRIYHNGSLANKNTGQSLTHTTLPFHSGVRNRNEGDDIGGHSTIDVNDLRFYNTALTEMEATNLCTTGRISG